MAANINPIFILEPKVGQVSTGTSANTALDGSGTVTLLFTAGANGAKLETIKLVHLGTNIATVVRFFLDNTGSAGYKLIHEISVSANTLDQTSASVQITYDANLIVPALGKVGVTIGTAIASGIMVSASGGNY